MKDAEAAPTDTLRRSELDSPPKVWGIHLLDHDPGGQAAVTGFLGKAGFLVSVSSNVPDAFDYAARSQPDILIASMELPGLSLPHFVHRLRSVSPSTRVLLTSIRSDWGAYEEAHLCGAASLVTRPLHLMTLLRALERLIDGKGGPARGLAAS